MPSTELDQVFASLPELDSRFQETIDTFLRASSGEPGFDKLTFAELCDRLDTIQSPLVGLKLIRSNLKTVVQNTSNQNIAKILNYLYFQNDTATIKKISDSIKKTGTPSTVATNYFLLAKYYYSRENWKGVKAALASLNNKELSTSDQHYYLLLMGYVLQELKEHRQAYGYYKQIPPESPYYAHAKLNESTAYLRQGWWTEAHIELKKAIASQKQGADRDFLDRLYSVLGYSQLHYEFYRDSRETLRNVSLNSAYTNKALMGLGLSAAYQKDFPGAINAFKILADKTPQDLNVDEVKLLLPKAYEEVSDFSSSAINYQNAILYYQKKLLRLDSILMELNGIAPKNLGKKVKELDLVASEVYGNKRFIPSYFYETYELILDMQNSDVKDPQVNRQVDELLRRYQQQLKYMVKENIELRKAMLESYLSQAKFGMAKLYDKD